ncbi:MAG: restriction endonuclease [Deltaproteobacteria bacterium]|nr:restriction endonuclease [Deltaproteobacteria bacterium]
MRIIDTYSHLNGEEYLIARKPDILKEIYDVIEKVDASECITKKSNEKTMKGKRLYSPRALNNKYKVLFNSSGWDESRYDYYITTNRDNLNIIVNLTTREQKKYLKSVENGEPLKSYKQTDFVKENVAVEVQFGKYAFVAYDLFIKHMLFYSGGMIDVGVEILPVMSMLKDPKGGRMMSTGIAYFEGEVYNVLRHGRTSPPVPLFIIGIAP